MPCCQFINVTAQCHGCCEVGAHCPPLGGVVSLVRLRGSGLQLSWEVKG